jgi:Carboxypeptidase regulatory-like domain
MKSRFVVSILAVLASAPLIAQEFRATINGQVLDETKAAISDATVSVTNTETNETASVKSNAQGNYTIPFLRPGSYTLSIEAAGFKKHTRTGLILAVSQVATIDVEMAVGGLTEELTVTAATPLLESSKADRGEVIDNKRIAELPLQARNPFSLSILVAGVNYNAQAIYLRPFDNGALADWSMNGGANRNNEFLLDGVPNNANVNGNNIAYVPPAESVQEFKISTNSYDAQYGRTAGGVVNVSLKSGTNTFHGTGYEFYRRSWLDANSFLLNAQGRPKSEHYLDQYGFSFDGPVMIPKVYNGKNKTFFLLTYERYREGTPAPLFATTPTEAMRNGDFSNYRDVNGNLIRIYDPNTGRDVNGAWIRDPFPNNIIPPDRINPVARQILSYYPMPNTTTAGSPAWQNNLGYSEHINKDIFWNWVGKVDHNFGPNNRFFARWGQNNRNEIRNFNPIRSGAAQDGQLPLIRTNEAFVADWVSILGPTTVLNIRGGYSEFIEIARSDEAFGFDAATLGFDPALVAQLPYHVFPRIQGNVAAELTNLARNNHSTVPSRTWSIQPNLSMTRGSHNIRTGLDMRYIHVDPVIVGSGGMQIEFDRTFTQADFSRADVGSGSAVASMLLGAPIRGFIDNNVKPGYRWSYFAPWVQDDWKVTNKLTLNLGFRWDFNSPVGEKDLQQNYIFDPSVANPVSSRINAAQFPQFTNLRGGLTFVGLDGNPDRPWHYDKNNFQFRAGGAYQINSRTVFRAGYGRYFLNPTAQGQTQGFSIQSPVVGSNDGNRTPLYNLANPFPSGVAQPPGSSLGLLTFLGRDVFYSDADFQVPYVDQFSVGVQREIPWGVVVEASYVGSRSRSAQTEFRGVNEPPRSLQDRCDVTQGGIAAFCNEQLPNPFYQVPGFQGTARFTSQTLSRFELSRPFPQFGNIVETERNDGKINYDSLQFVGNKRWSKGLTLNATYTYVPRFDVVGSASSSAGSPTPTGAGTQLNAFIDNATAELNVSPYFTHRTHRFTASGVWEFPFGEGRTGLLGLLMKGWSVAPMFVYQSGQPWLLPQNTELSGDPSIPVEKTGQFIYGAQPCVGQRAPSGNYVLIPISVAYGCTQPYFLVREPFQARETMFWDDRLRRPGFWQLDLNFAKATQITERVRLQIRFEAFNIFNSPMYDERDYNRDQTVADFARINRNVTGQSNFQRFVQLGFRLTF